MNAETGKCRKQEKSLLLYSLQYEPNAPNLLWRLVATNFTELTQISRGSAEVLPEQKIHKIVRKKHYYSSHEVHRSLWPTCCLGLTQSKIKAYFAGDCIKRNLGRLWKSAGIRMVKGREAEDRDTKKVLKLCLLPQKIHWTHAVLALALDTLHLCGKTPWIPASPSCKYCT